MVYPPTTHEFHCHIVVEPIVELTGAHRERCHKFPFMKSFCPIRDNAHLIELHHRIDNHFRMDAQILLVL